MAELSQESSGTLQSCPSPTIVPAGPVHSSHFPWRIHIVLASSRTGQQPASRHFHSFFLFPQPILAPCLCLSNPYRVFGTCGNPHSSLEPLLISRFRHNPSLLLSSFSRCCAGVDCVRVLCPTDMGTALSPSLKRIYHEAFHEGESETN